MRLWFSADSEVPIYRQLVTQVVLAILSGDLKAGERLPSTRELARRFSIHPNTVSAGYRQLEREGWTEYRHGSGVYVKPHVEAPTTPEQVLEQHIAQFFRMVRELNLPAEMVRARVGEWLKSPPPDHFLVVDPDAELRQILLAELKTLTAFPLREADVVACTNAERLKGAIPLCRPSKTKMVRDALPAGVELVTLPIRSANQWLAPWRPALKGRLLGVASHWADFLENARTMLTAAGVEPDLLVLRHTRRPRWQRGLEQTAAIICDVHTAAHATFPKGPRVMPFAIVADAAKAELLRYSEYK
jgi:GntR family transcriptional regulator